MRKGPQMAKRVKIPKLPQLLDRKIYKSGQTRGADDDTILTARKTGYLWGNDRNLPPKA